MAQEQRHGEIDSWEERATTLRRIWYDKLASVEYDYLRSHPWNFDKCENRRENDEINRFGMIMFLTPNSLNIRKTKTEYGGGKPLELNRILRPGGFFVWSPTHVYRY
ncbi:hypothetical protein ZIOFF_049096 [Zingiber officinale]|uniref:Uncharacterized protein n=1 Tax=Zingiber officinale TaxID=94328 RepID=A0A8J5FXM6_ZINOF|nr:hypothetical protein ZIOFF_049096 [Zingiber officinale]